MTITLDQLKGKSLRDLMEEASGQQTFQNMQKLCNQTEYTIAGETYKRHMLKPRERVEVEKLQKVLDDPDITPEERMESVKKQAFICLEGLTDEKWENTDSTKMEIVVGACILISKGFCDV